VKASADEDAATFGRRDIAKGALAGLSAPVIAAMPAGPAKAEEVSKYWDIVDLPLEPGVILLDIAFVDDKHGFLLGTRQTILETFDGGKTWDFKSVSNALDEDVNYRFNSVSFKGQEGWIVGKPAILLHTTDGGANWERVGLSPRLPGAPVLITATNSNGQAEMVTDEGAIYLTTDAARNWKAAVEETISATLNRTVSSGHHRRVVLHRHVLHHLAQRRRRVHRPVFARELLHDLVARPGVLAAAQQVVRAPRAEHGVAPGRRHLGAHPRRRHLLLHHQRASRQRRRLRGGQDRLARLRLARPRRRSPTARSSGSWAARGACSTRTTRGRSWKRDRGADDVAANLYTVKFNDNDNGFILGNDGVLLKYNGRAV
jgi:photosystem II stability/assembly factor-like uncharacterized protein